MKGDILQKYLVFELLLTKQKTYIPQEALDSRSTTLAFSSKLLRWIMVEISEF
jgi:hypothetical protein